MLGSKGFDLWAAGYDAAVGLSEEENSYPFAGYKQVLGGIYRAIREAGAKTVLDIGFGTGTLAHRLYQDGCAITGIDFSPRMIELAQAKMPDARLICHDFSTGLPEGLATFDCIVSTYALHHLTDTQKCTFIHQLMQRLVPGGQLLIGDVAFETREKLENCRLRCGDEWDDEEFYFVTGELEQRLGLPVAFEPCSFCAGILRLKNN